MAVDGVLTVPDYVDGFRSVAEGEHEDIGDDDLGRLAEIARERGWRIENRWGGSNLGRTRASVRDLEVFQRYIAEVNRRTADPIGGAPNRSGFVYLSTSDTEVAERFFDAFVELLASGEVEVERDGPPVVGSWLQRFAARARRVAAEPAVLDGAEKAVHAVEVAAVRRPMAEVNVNQADAILRLSQAASAVDEFVAITDGVVLVKATGADGKTRMVTRTLTVAQIREMERRRSFGLDPAQMLRFLESTSLTRSEETEDSSVAVSDGSDNEEK